MALNQISTIADSLGASLRNYHSVASAIQRQSGDLPIVMMQQLASAAQAAGQQAVQLSAEIPRAPGTATAKLADMGIGSIADFQTHMVAIQTAAAALNRAYNEMVTAPGNVAHFAVMFRPVVFQPGQAPVGVLKGPDTIPGALASGYRTSDELQALIDALVAAGAG